MKTALKNPLRMEFSKARMQYFVEAQKYKRGLPPGIRISKEVQLPPEIPLDADRQKLELDITKEFEFADTQLI